MRSVRATHLDVAYGHTCRHDKGCFLDIRRQRQAGLVRQRAILRRKADMAEPDGRAIAHPARHVRFCGRFRVISGHGATFAIRLLVTQSVISGGLFAVVQNNSDLMW